MNSFSRISISLLLSFVCVSAALSTSTSTSTSSTSTSLSTNGRGHLKLALQPPAVVEAAKAAVVQAVEAAEAQDRESSSDSNLSGRDLLNTPAYPLSTVATAATFLDAITLGDKPTLALGKPTTLLTSVVNNGDEAITVKLIRGSLNSIYDFRVMIANTSVDEVDVEIPPKQEATFDHTFTPVYQGGAGSGSLDATLFVGVWFIASSSSDLSQTHANMIYNETVALYEDDGGLGDLHAFLISAVFVLALVFFAAKILLSLMGFDFDASSIMKKVFNALSSAFTKKSLAHGKKYAGLSSSASPSKSPYVETGTKKRVSARERSLDGGWDEGINPALLRTRAKKQ